MRKGRVVAEEDKETMLTSSNVSALFGCGVELIEHNGYYQAVSGE